MPGEKVFRRRRHISRFSFPSCQDDYMSSSFQKVSIVSYLLYTSSVLLISMTDVQRIRHSSSQCVNWYWGSLLIHPTLLRRRLPGHCSRGSLLTLGKHLHSLKLALLNERLRTFLLKSIILFQATKVSSMSVFFLLLLTCQIKPDSTSRTLSP